MSIDRAWVEAIRELVVGERVEKHVVRAMGELEPTDFYDREQPEPRRR
jgi:hypothetical protein